jgi:hypothetical protein
MPLMLRKNDQKFLKVTPESLHPCKKERNFSRRQLDSQTLNWPEKHLSSTQLSFAVLLEIFFS